MKKLIVSVVMLGMLALGLASTAEAKVASGDCSCNPACDVGVLCCPTAGNSCGCFAGLSRCP